MADRTIEFDTGLDLSKLKADLKRAEDAVKKFQDEIEANQSKSSDANKKLENIRVEYEEAAKYLKELQNMSSKEQLELIKSGGPTQADLVAEQEEAVKDLQAQYVSAQKNADKMAEALEKSKSGLEKATERAAELRRQIQDNTHSTSAFQNAGKAVDDMFNSIGKRLKTMAKRVLIFSVFLKILRQVKTYFSQAIAKNNEAAQAVGRMKGAFATMAQPIVSALIPAVITLANWLTKVLTAVTQIMAKLSGKKLKDFQKAAKNQAGGTGKSGQLASFDTINKLEDGSGSAADQIEAVYDASELADSELEKILTVITLIGAALAAWKFPLSGNTFTSFIGYLALIEGLVIAVKNYLDAWNNGIDMKNLMGILGGIALAVGGLAILFGVTGAAIGLLIGGIALMVLAFKDIAENGLTVENTLAMIAGAALAIVGVGMLFGPMAAGIVALIAGVVMLALGFQDVDKNGVTLQNTLMIIAGIIATGLGISLLTGSMLPLLVAGILAVIFAFVALGGEGEELIAGLKQLFGGFIKFITGVFTGDWEKAWEGIKDIFKGIWNSMLAIVGGVVNAMIKGLNWLISKINTISFDVPDWVPLVGGKGVGFNIPQVAEWTVPYLAQGAVIPPNREFLAVLGDQKSGTNIEAPLDTLIEAFKAASNGQSININFSGELAPLARLFRVEIQKEDKRQGGSLIKRGWY